MSRLEMRHLRAALLLASEGGFTRAATAMGIPQPQFSVLVQRLEDVAGTPLFTRRPSVRLTPAGERLLPWLRTSLDAASAGFREVQRLKEGDLGVLSIGLPTWSLATFVPGAIAAFRRRRPLVELKLHDVSSAAQMEMLVSGRLDVAILRYAPQGVANLRTEEIWAEPFCAVLPEGHRLTGLKLSVSDLEGEPYIGFPRVNAPPLHDEIRALWRNAGLEPVVVQEAQEWLTILGLVDLGMGVSIVPQSLQRLWPRQLHFAPLADPGAVARVHACYREGAPRAVTEFMLDVRQAAQASSTR